MAKLVIRSEELSLEVIKLKGGLNRFGRSSQNDFQIDHPTVSRFHAEIVLGDEWMFVRDTDSSNGVFVNGERVSECLLESGQVLRLGEVSLEVKDAPVFKSGLELAARKNLTDLVHKLLKRKESVSVLPARMAGEGAVAGIICCPACREKIVVPAETVNNLSAHARIWRQRALAAERRAEQAQAAIRTGVLPHFADWLKQKFIRVLVSERSQLIEVQETAAAEMAHLERRLDELHTPLQERLRTYEKRIAELEKLLAAKGEENRELLKAKIQMTRRQLETVRSLNPLELN